MRHERHQEQQNRPHPGHIDHQHDPVQHSSPEHSGHDKHAGHSPAMFQRRFLI